MRRFPAYRLRTADGDGGGSRSFALTIRPVSAAIMQLDQRQRRRFLQLCQLG